MNKTAYNAIRAQITNANTFREQKIAMNHIDEFRVYDDYKLKLVDYCELRMIDFPQYTDDRLLDVIYYLKLTDLIEKKQKSYDELINIYEKINVYPPSKYLYNLKSKIKEYLTDITHEINKVIDKI